MTPEATYSALALFDRWALTLRTLAGEPLPALPDLPGRRIVAHDEPLSEDEVRDVVDPVQLGLLLGISRQAAAQRLARRALADDTEGGAHD
jgi:hypothetical protein